MKAVMASELVSEKEDNLGDDSLQSCSSDDYEKATAKVRSLFGEAILVALESKNRFIGCCLCFCSGLFALHDFIMNWKPSLLQVKFDYVLVSLLQKRKSVTGN